MTIGKLFIILCVLSVILCVLALVFLHIFSNAIEKGKIYYFNHFSACNWAYSRNSIHCIF